MKHNISSTIKFISGGEELLPKIEPLWKLLNEHHANVSRYFSEDFHAFSFENRIAKIKKVYQQGKLRVDIAIEGQIPVGYIIGGIHEENIGEIESIFILETHRNISIGEALMNHCVDWLRSAGVENMIVKVAVGNESVFPFYEKYGFLPRLYTLKQRLDQDHR